MNLPIIQSLWIGEDLSNLEKLCVQSFLDHGHQFHLHTYGDIGGVPAGAVIKDANEILPASDVFMSTRNVSSRVSAFSDWFRWALLAKRGGWWVDMDLACIKPFDFADEIILSRQANDVISGILRFPAGHEFPVFMEKRARQTPNKANADWGAMAGPLGTDACVDQFNLRQLSKSELYFVPITWDRWEMAFDDTFADDVGWWKVTHAVHFANNQIGLAGVDKNARFHPQSLFEQLKEKHGIITAGDAPTISPAEVYRLSNTKKSSHRRRLKQRSRQQRKLHAGIALAVGLAAGITIGVLF